MWLLTSGPRPFTDTISTYIFKGITLMCHGEITWIITLFSALTNKRKRISNTTHNMRTSWFLASSSKIYICLELLRTSWSCFTVKIYWVISWGPFQLCCLWSRHVEGRQQQLLQLLFTDSVKCTVQKRDVCIQGRISVIQAPYTPCNNISKM